MLTRRTLTAVVLAAAHVALPAAVSAQGPDPLQAIQCPRQPLESDLEWKVRCDYEQQKQAEVDRDRRVRDAERRTAETARQRAILEKQPPLPASRNPLLGRWETSTRPAPDADPFAQIAAMFTGCGVLLGDGIVEFGPDRWAVYDGDGRNEMGAISYRAGTKGVVFGLPAKGSIFELLPFEFDSPDQVHLIGVVCTLRRTNATVPGGGASGTAPSSQTRPAATPAAPAAAPRGASAPATRSRLYRFNGRMGYDCPDGADVAVDSCTSEADDATCVVVRVDQPPKNGVEVTFTETRASLVKRIASCKMRPLMVLDGTKIEFAP